MSHISKVGPCLTLFSQLNFLLVRDTHAVQIYIKDTIINRGKAVILLKKLLKKQDKAG